MPAGHDGERWKDRRVLAAMLGVAIATFPIGCSVGAAIALRVFIPPPATIVGFALWWLGTLGMCTVVFLATERVARRVVPLAVLLKMGMAFPGRAPRRLAVARQAGSVRDLHRRVEQARTRGLADEPTVAAERIVTLAATLSAHDRTTRGHAERVRALTDMIAEELHLPALHRDRLRWSSLLHDIGKLTVHPDTLNKSSTLSKEEWEILRRHPLEGARLTAPIAGWLGEWASTIAEHHERFDGRGYPYGVAGRRISLGGRIVAVADSFDTMTSARSYKKPIAPDRARQELAACAGTQFDPEVVRAFLAVSVWRLRLAAPLSWLASMSSAKVVGAAARVGTLSGHSVLAGVAAAAGVLGLTVAMPLASSSLTPTTAAASAASSVAATQGSVSGPPGATSPPGAGAAAHSTIPTAAGNGRGGGATTTTGSARGTTTTTTSRGTGGAAPGGGSGAPGGGKATGTTTTVATTTTTTTAALPALPAPPSGLSATGQCQLLVIGPEVSLSWSPSPSPSVTSYSVLRKNGGGSGGSFGTIANVAPGTTTYDDTSAGGLGATYTYEIQANAPGGNATSAIATATTPVLCL